ncbi:PREDICTED: uncharacterized protein At2g39795, mitochondrial-like [Camelina sativa]|uniref:Uncharacterized protein At2g39795, mitochondrial-like n=1 Tax=Camelina sativa TaxID=90675 RepID=A0ABM0SLF3_CAMSA|nr:PREDICTED: uncharacterized protein At2g39795, mitochondrial-like [Camelina sativa]
MALAWFAVRRSASNFASLCGGRVRMISTVVDRPSLALNPSPPCPFVSSSFHYPTVVDQLSSEQTLIRELTPRSILLRESMICLRQEFVSVKTVFLFVWLTLYWEQHEEMTPESSPFRIEDDGGKTVTVSIDYKGEHIKVVVGLPIHGDNDTKYEDGTLDYYRGNGLMIPLTVNVTKKIGLSLEFRCKVINEYDGIHIDGVFGDHSVDSLKYKLTNEGSYFKDVDHKLQMAFYKYLETRLTKGTMYFLYHYMMTNERRHFLWLKDVKKFLDDES